MTDREKVITHLQIIHTWADVFGESGRGIDPVFCREILRWIDETLEWLKTQEPRVMTHEEVINLPEGAVAWFEEMDNESRRYIQPMMSNGKAFMIGTHVDVNVSRGTLNWTNRRFWTSCPTYELMEATQWNDMHNLGIGKK